MLSDLSLHQPQRVCLWLAGLFRYRMMCTCEKCMSSLVCSVKISLTDTQKHLTMSIITGHSPVSVGVLSNMCTWVGLPVGMAISTAAVCRGVCERDLHCCETALMIFPLISIFGRKSVDRTHISAHSTM